MSQNIGKLPGDRDQIISFLLARGDEKDTQIAQLQEANAVLGGQIADLQKRIDALTPDKGTQQPGPVPPQTGEATPGA